MIDLSILDPRLVAAIRFVAAGNKQRALEELGDARALVKAEVEELARAPEGVRFTLPAGSVGAMVYGTGHPAGGTFYPAETGE